MDAANSRNGNQIVIQQDATQALVAIISVELSIHYLRVQVSHTEVFGSNSERKAILKKV